jgi:hypothetical protein
MAELNSALVTLAANQAILANYLMVSVGAEDSDSDEEEDDDSPF